MQNRTEVPQTQGTETPIAGNPGKEPQPIPGDPGTEKQKPEIPEMPDKEVPEMPVRQTDAPQAPVTGAREQQWEQTTPTQGPDAVPQQTITTGSKQQQPTQQPAERTQERKAAPREGTDDRLEEQQSPMK